MANISHSLPTERNDDKQPTIPSITETRPIKQMTPTSNPPLHINGFMDANGVQLAQHGSPATPPPIQRRSSEPMKSKNQQSAVDGRKEQGVYAPRRSDTDMELLQNDHFIHQQQFIPQQVYYQQFVGPRPFIHRPMLRPSSVHSDSAVAFAPPTTDSSSVSSDSFFGSSIDELRQRAKASKDPSVHLSLAKELMQRINSCSPAGSTFREAQKKQALMSQEALKWLNKASSPGFNKTGLAEALYLLGECYGNGHLGLAVDLSKAFNCYSQAAKASYVDAMYRLAICYEVGAGTKRDFSRAFAYYKRSAVAGDTAAMYKMGIIHLKGSLGQSENLREGISWLQRSAAQADKKTPHALHELALIYEGEDKQCAHILPPDQMYAQSLLFQAAKLDHAPSQYKLGLCFEYGSLCLPIDPRHSIAWYSKAAQQSEPEAELALSGWYLTGSSGILEQNDREAYLWAKKAAAKGLAKAEYAVGYFLENGIGAAKDLEECRRWYMRSAAQGNKRAVQRINELNGNVTPVKSASSPADKRNFRATKGSEKGDCSIM